MVLLLALMGGVLAGTWWGAFDLGQALLTVGGGSFPKSVALTLTVYAATGGVMALCLALWGRIRGWEPDTTLAAAVGLPWIVCGVGVLVMLGNMHWFPGLRTLTGKAVNVIVLVCLGAAGYGGVRLIWRQAARVARLTRLAVPLTVVLWGALLGYSAWTGLAPSVVVTDPPQGQAQADRPSFLILVVDSMRADHVPVYGYARGLTPHMDRLAAEGVVFRQAYAQTSWTLPSVASILTSLYPSYHGATKRWETLAEDVHTLPELLKQQGYATAAFSVNPYISRTYGLHQGFDAVYQANQPERHSFLPFVLGFKAYTRLEGRVLPLLKHLRVPLFTLFGLEEEKWANCRSDRTINQALTDWLAAQQRRPFFAYVHYMCPHYPYFPPGEARLEWQMQVLLQGLQVPEEQRRELLAVYDKTITYSDTLIGDVVSQLQRQQRYDDTVVMVTADHGEEFYDHQGWIHGETLYNEVIKVPLLVRFPPLVPRQRVVETPVMLVDLLPTVLAVAGVPVEHFIHGVNLLPTLAGELSAGQAYSELIGRVSDPKAQQVFATLIRHGRKFIRTVDRSVSQVQSELYDMAEDAGEQHNIWPMQTDTAQQRWEDALKTFAAPGRRYRGERAVLSEKMKQRLRALGYIQ